MLTLLLVAGGLAVWLLLGTLLGLAVGRTIRHGEEQDRQTRHTDPHAAYWGRSDPAAPTTPEQPADSRTRPRHRRHR